MRGRSLIGVLALVPATACTAAHAPSTAAKPTVHAYSFVGLTRDHRAGERLTLTWKATRPSNNADAPPPAQLCVALAW